MKRIVFVIVLALSSLVSQAQSHDKVYAVFVMNFAKYIMWPSSKNSGEFVIGVLGTSPIFDELKAAAAQKTIGSQKIMVKDCKTSKDVDGCHLVFVTENKSGLVSEVITKLSTEPTLVVTEKEGLAKNGGGISFAESSGKVRFEINKGAIEKKGLSVASALTNLGVVVQD